MKIFKNINYPLKIRRTHSDAESINIPPFKNIFYNRSVNINSLNVDATSYAIFVEPNKNNLPNLTISSGELLIIDKDSVVLDNITILNGGVMRVI
jgi:hypothetical protein